MSDITDTIDFCGQMAVGVERCIRDCVEEKRDVGVILAGYRMATIEWNDVSQTTSLTVLPWVPLDYKDVLLGAYYTATLSQYKVTDVKYHVANMRERKLEPEAAVDQHCLRNLTGQDVAKLYGGK